MRVWGVACGFLLCVLVGVGVFLCVVVFGVFLKKESSVFWWDFNLKTEIKFRFQFKYLKGQLFTAWKHSLLFPDHCFIAGGRWTFPFGAVHKLPWSTCYLPSWKMYSQGLAARYRTAWKLWQTHVVHGGVWLDITVLSQAETEGDFRPNPSGVTK